MSDNSGSGTGYVWERQGDDFSFAWGEHGIAIEVGAIRESRDADIICELSPQFLQGDLLSPLIAPTKVNLSSATGKSSCVKALSRWEFKGWDWVQCLETVAAIIMREWRAGAPWVDLSEVEWDEEIDWLIYPFLPRGEIVLMYGDGESGKSMWAAYLAYCVRTGRTPINSKATPDTEAKVLYLDYETHSDSMQARRFGRISAGFGEELSPGIWRRQCFRPLADEANHLAAQIAKRGVELVIVDSLAWAAAGDINEAAIAIKTLNAIRQLGCSVIVIAHISKSERNYNGRRAIAGSVFFENGPRLTWEVRASKEDGNVTQTIYQRKVNEGETLGKPFGQKLTFPNEAGRPIVFEQIDVKVRTAEGAKLRDRIADFLTSCTSPQTIATISDELDAKDKTVRTTLKRMESSGTVVWHRQPREHHKEVGQSRPSSRTNSPPNRENSQHVRIAYTTH